MNLQTTISLKNTSTLWNIYCSHVYKRICTMPLGTWHWKSGNFLFPWKRFLIDRLHVKVSKTKNLQKTWYTSTPSLGGKPLESHDPLTLLGLSLKSNLPTRMGVCISCFLSVIVDIMYVNSGGIKEFGFFWVGIILKSFAYHVDEGFLQWHQNRWQNRQPSSH